MKSIKLEQSEWEFDEAKPLGPAGGFGEVFKGRGEIGEVAIKRLKLTADKAAHRELRVGSALRGRSLVNVVPVLDCGQDALSDRYFLVMPVCEKSLQDDIQRLGKLPLSGARSVMLEIMSGLNEVSELVHRDLKPGNVLFGAGKWQVADFGIAKFVEDSTSLNTLRGSLTPSYGAPEQWRGEAPTGATDIYALGCIMHAMLTGLPPFTGSVDDVREAHLHNPPAPLNAAGPRLEALINHMLRKSPGARPTLKRCIEVFKADIIPSQGVAAGHAGLKSAAAVIAAEEAAADAKQQAEATRTAARQQLAKEAHTELVTIRERLFASVKEVAESATLQGRNLILGKGTLLFAEPISLAGSKDGGVNLPMCDWDVVLFGEISVSRPHNVSAAKYQYDNAYRWSASLVFAKATGDPSYRWREVSFWSMGRTRDNNEPRSVAPTERDFAVALSNTMGVMNVAFGPCPIDGEDEARFQHRWITLLSKAATGALDRPNQMPIAKNYFSQS